VALIKCGECGREVSDKATTCVGCGVPLTAAEVSSRGRDARTTVTRRGGKWEAAGTVLVIVGLIFYITTGEAFGGIAMLVGFVVFIIGRFQ
jgi:uncharacterized OB-fold protein